MSSNADFSTTTCKAFSRVLVPAVLLLLSACAKDHDAPSFIDQPNTTQAAPSPTPSVLASPTPSPTATPTIAHRPNPTATPKIKPTSSPKPGATATPKPTASPKPTSTPKVPAATAAVLDKTANGGQPGFVYLSGAFVDASSNLVSNVHIDEEAGLGWRGTRAKMRAGLEHLSPTASTSNASSIADASNDGTYISYGCDVSKFDSLKSLKPMKATSTSSTQVVVKAQVVAFCGNEPFETLKATTIIASRVIFSSLSLTSPSATTRLLSILTNRLTLLGENTLTLKGNDGAWTDQAAPSLVMSTKTLDGSGRLYIDSKGANYVKGASPHASPTPKP